MAEPTKKYTGYIEKPKYINGELIKAVDVVVDELIGKPYKDKIETVTKASYDLLNTQRLAAIATGSLYYNNWQSALGVISNLELEIESYKQIVDSEKILTAVANNETQASNERYASLLSDFQSAITKGVQEAIARVSLEAQVRGLQAQKEILKTQYDALKVVVANMQAQYDALQQQIVFQQAQFEITQEQLQAQIEAEQVRQAAAETLEGIQGTFAQSSSTGWKLPQFEIVKSDKVLYIETYDDDTVKILQGTAVNLYNFSETEAAVFTLKVSGDAAKWLQVPASITIPPRVGNVAGRGYASFKWKPKTDDVESGWFTGNRKQTYTGAITITSSFGETHTVKAEYWREVNRKDTWSPRGIVQTVVGKEYSKT